MNRTSNILFVLGCLISIAAAFIFSVSSAGTAKAPKVRSEPTAAVSLPPLKNDFPDQPTASAITRAIQIKTRLQDDVIYEIIEYKVKPGDSLWSIAQQFDLEPETILWGNEWLSSAGILQIGDKVSILPVDGVLHTVKAGDTLETIEQLHGTPAQEILEYFGNGFDLTQPPQLSEGQEIIVPHGTSPIVWSEAQAPAAANYSGKYPNLGTGYYVWPVAPPYTLTQEYWGGHPAIDVDTYFRQPIFAADSGTVAFSGWDDTGYGNLVIIDHGNGYQTYYGHNEANLVGTGQMVMKGQQIAESGSTGNSSGEHLDFRILYGGSFLNPLEYLP
jgi:LysM repeat protein